MEDRFIRNEVGEIIGLYDASPLAVAFTDLISLLRDGAYCEDIVWEIISGLGFAERVLEKCGR